MRFASLALLLSAACIERTATIPESPEQHAATSFDIPADTAVPYDILVVVDSSPAMAAHNARVIPQLGEMFLLIGRGDPDWHLGVITSDLGGPGCSERGDDGMFRHDGLVGAPFLIEWQHADDRHTRNYEGTLSEAFIRLASVGSAGCTRQQPLAAVRRALEDQPRNAGFRREGANLAVVIVSAVDDSSPELVADHVAFLGGAAPERRVLIAGVFDRPAPRLEELFAAFPNQARTSALSVEDIRNTLHILIFNGGHWGVPCIEGDIGQVPECSVSDVLIEDGYAVHETLLARCDARQSVLPCWHMEVNDQFCPSWEGYRHHVLEVERRDYPPVGTHVRGSCVTRSGQNP